jgi:hypothetical protein
MVVSKPNARYPKKVLDKSRLKKQGVGLQTEGFFDLARTSQQQCKKILQVSPKENTQN